MKISEMTNDQATEAMIRISQPISNICDDEEMVTILDEIKNMKGEPIVKSFGKMLPKAVMYALRKHKSDLYEIIGALTGKTTTAVGKMNFKETIDVMKDSYDDVLSGFFTHSDPIQKVSEDK